MVGDELPAYMGHHHSPSLIEEGLHAAYVQSGRDERVFFSVFSVFGVRLGTGVPAGIGRDLEHLSLNILKKEIL